MPRSRPRRALATPSPRPATVTLALAQGDIVRTMASLRMAGRHIMGELHALVKALLGKGTRDGMLAWLANAIEGNGERAKMRVGGRRGGGVFFWGKGEPRRGEVLKCWAGRAGRNAGPRVRGY